MTRRLIKIGLVLAPLVVVAGLAQAQSLKVRKAQQSEEAAFQSEVAYTNQICDANISAELDWSSISQASPKAASGSCDAV